MKMYSAETNFLRTRIDETIWYWSSENFVMMHYVLVRWFDYDIWVKLMADLCRGFHIDNWWEERNEWKQIGILSILFLPNLSCTQYKHVTERTNNHRRETFALHVPTGSIQSQYFKRMRMDFFVCVCFRKKNLREHDMESSSDYTYETDEKWGKWDLIEPWCTSTGVGIVPLKNIFSSSFIQSIQNKRATL